MISVASISERYNITVFGDINIILDNIGSILKYNESSLTWAKTAEHLTKFNCGAVICRDTDFNQINQIENVCYLVSKDSPKLIFSKIVSEFFVSSSLEDDFVNYVDRFRDRQDLTIGDNVFIARNVIIGSGTIIYHNSSIFSNSVIGENCVINVNSSIGTEGLGLELDKSTDLYVKFPQLGGVILEDHVEVGPNSTIRRSALDNTIVKRGTKIGSQCNIGHNCEVGRNCIITSSVILAGSSKIGDNVFLGVACSVRNAKNIGNRVTIGQGAVVVSNVPDNEIWVGNPAKKIS